MKKTIIALTLACGMCNPALAQDGTDRDKSRPATRQPGKGTDAAQPAAPKAGEQPRRNAAELAWEEAAKPGPQHAQLAKMAGEWDMVIEGMNPEDPAQTMRSTGRTVSKPVLGGRYMMSEVNATMMGQPFQGMEISGFNNTTKQFESAWVDSMGTAMMFMTGTADASGKTITYTGTMSDPMSGDKTPVRNVITHRDDNSFTFEMHMTQGGREVKMMTINYTRKGTGEAPRANPKATPEGRTPSATPAAKPDGR